MTREDQILSNHYLILSLLGHIIKHLPKEKNIVPYSRVELLSAIHKNQQGTAEHMELKE